MSEKVLFILMPEKYRDEEFTAPYEIIQKAGYHVDVAGFNKNEAKGVMGHSFTPNLLLDDLTNSDYETYEALVIPGGPASTTYLWNNKKIQDIVRYFHDNKKIVAAICYASMAPAQAGILDGKMATIFPTDEAKSMFHQLNVTFSNDGCVTLKEEKIITAQGPSFAKEFGKAILDLLAIE